MNEQTQQKLNVIISNSNRTATIASKHFTNDDYSIYILPFIELSNHSIELVKELDTELETLKKENELLRNNMLKSNKILSTKEGELINANIALEKLRTEISKK